MEQLERVVPRGLSGPGPCHLHAVARPALDVVRTEDVVDRPHAEPFAHLEFDRTQAPGLRGLGPEQLHR